MLQQNALAEKIRDRAYELYLARGGKSGTELQDWLRAEEEVLKEREAAIDEAAEESFPASDPPSY
jgi:hypothetical protein